MEKTKDLSGTLRRMARLAGLCDLWYDNWGQPDQQGLIDKALHGIDFICRKSFPDPEFILANFDKELLHRNNIFVSENVALRNTGSPILLLGNCDATLLYDGYATADVYACGETKLIVSARGLAKAFVSIYDKTSIQAIQDGGASLFVYKYSGDNEVSTIGNVGIREFDKLNIEESCNHQK